MTSTKTGQPPQFSGGGGGGGIKGALGELLDNDEVKAKLAKAGKRKLAGLLGKLVDAIGDLLDGDDDDDDDKKQEAQPQPGTSTPAPAPSTPSTPSTPAAPPALRRIEGGRAHLTGVHEQGPQGPEIKGERLREIRAGANGPSDGWYALDCTPKVEGEDLGPMPEREARSGKPYDRQVNPEAQGILSWDESTSAGDSGGHQVVRLAWDDELTAGTAELVHEGGNHGCTPRIKTRGARGRLTNLRFLAAGGVVIPCEPSTLFIGRQE